MFSLNSTYRIRDRLGNTFVMEYRRGERPGWHIVSGWLGVVIGSRATPVNISLIQTCVDDGDFVKEVVL